MANGINEEQYSQPGEQWQSKREVSRQWMKRMKKTLTSWQIEGEVSRQKTGHIRCSAHILATETDWERSADKKLGEIRVELTSWQAEKKRGQQTAYKINEEKHTSCWQRQIKRGQQAVNRVNYMPALTSWQTETEWRKLAGRNGINKWQHSHPNKHTHIEKEVS